MSQASLYASPCPGESVAVRYMATFPPERPKAPTFPKIETAKVQAAADLAELLSAIDEFVAGEALTEKIMSLRTKAAVIRDRMARRASP